MNTIKWLFHSVFGQWHQYWCWHADCNGNSCCRNEGHPGKCKTYEGKEFVP